MPLTIVRKRTEKAGRSKVVNLRANWPSAYVAGGIDFDPALFGIKNEVRVEFAEQGGYLFQFDPTNKRAQIFLPSVGHTHAPTTAQLLLSYGAKVKGSANTDSENADAAALPTNGSAAVAFATVAAGVFASGARTPTDIGRNVCVVIKNASGGALNLFQGVMTFTVTGLFKGAVQTETITFTSTGGNKAVADTKFRYKYGVKPFDVITTLVLDNVPDNNLQIGAGLGSKIGLPNALPTPIEADVKKISKNTADLAVTGLVDTTNSTVNLGTLADNDQFTILYLGQALVASFAAAAAAVATELADGTSLAILDHPISIYGT